MSKQTSPLVAITFGMVATCVNGIYQHSTTDHVSFTVNDKYIDYDITETCDEETGACETDITSRYIVEARHLDGEHETFENTMALLSGKFRTSWSLQKEFRVGERYDARVYGYDIPWIGKYRNIVSAEHVPRAQYQ